jgi:lambda repressor-like predicted transcriptional regulator
VSVSSVSGTQAAALSVGNTRPDPMANVSQLLNMSPSDIRAARQGGESLSDLASKQGVSRDDLVKAIESDLKSRMARGGANADGTSPTAGTSTDNVAQLAAKIADNTSIPKHGGHHHHHGGSPMSIIPATSDSSTVSDQLAKGAGVSVLL